MRHALASQRHAPLRWALCLLLSANLAWPLPLLAQAPAGGKEGGKEVVAVLDFDGAGASAVEAGAVSDRLREELLRSGQFTVVDRGQIEAILNEQALQQTGCTTQECAVQVGQILGVRKIISGRVTKLSEDQWLVTAQLVDVETGESLTAQSLRHRGDLFTLVDVTIVELARKIIGGAGKDVGALVAELPPPGPGQAAAQPADSGLPWWGWLLIGVGVLGLVAASGSSSSSDSSGSGGSGGGTTGAIGVSW